MSAQQPPIWRLAAASAVLLGAVVGAVMLALGAPPLRTALVAAIVVLCILAGYSTVMVVDHLLSRLVESKLKRERGRAAARYYQQWTGTDEPAPAGTMRVATTHSAAGTGKLRWLEDDQPGAREWRALLVEMLRWAHTIWQQTGGERTGLTEADLVGVDKMFETTRAYLTAVRVLVGTGIAVRPNGLPTRLEEAWTYRKGMAYLQTSAPLLDIPPDVPRYRRLPGRALPAMAKRADPPARAD